MRGVVKWYVDTKGFGFLVGEDGTDYFVRQENIEIDGFKGLEKGSEVIFELSTDEDGKLEATCVRPVSVPVDPAKESSGRAEGPRSAETASGPY
jgi:CspA family cold shock protein